LNVAEGSRTNQKLPPSSWRGSFGTRWSRF